MIRHPTGASVEVRSGFASEGRRDRYRRLRLRAVRFARSGDRRHGEVPMVRLTHCRGSLRVVVRVTPEGGAREKKTSGVDSR